MVASISSTLKSRSQEHNCVYILIYLLLQDIIIKLRDTTIQHLGYTGYTPIEETFG